MVSGVEDNTMYYIYGTIVGKNDETEEVGDDFFFFLTWVRKRWWVKKKISILMILLNRPLEPKLLAVF